MRVILGAPWWTCIENLRQKTGLVFLKARIKLVVANHTGKCISRPDQWQIDSTLCNTAFYPLDFPLHNLPWHWGGRNSLEELNPLQVMKERGADKPHHAYSSPKPWDPHMASFITNSLMRSKAQSSPTDIKNLKCRINTIEQERDIAVIYTDGSIDQQSSWEGSAFVYKNLVFNSSSLQANLYAITAALTCTLFLEENHLYILTDSLSAIHVLQQDPISENVSLITAVPLQGRSAITLKRVSNFHVDSKPCLVTGQWDSR